MSDLSVNVGRYEAGEYFVTAAEWNSPVTGGKSYEIGIRHKSLGNFWLLQSHKWNHQTVQEMANAIAHILSMPTECYTPEWILEHFT